MELELWSYKHYAFSPHLRGWLLMESLMGCSDRVRLAWRLLLPIVNITVVRESINSDENESYFHTFGEAALFAS